MDAKVLKGLLIEYDKKRRIADEIAEKNKQQLYEDFPKLAEIDKQINTLAISTMKDVIQNGNLDLIANLTSKINVLKTEKDAIFQSIGPRVNSIFPNYECSKCGDTGYIKVNNKSQMCSCLTQRIYNMEYNKSNIYSLEKQNFKSFNINLFSDNVNEQKYNSDISPRENIKLILNICRNFIDNFDNIDEKNLLFTGKTGLGKTFLSSCIANELIQNGKTVLYQTSSVMLDTIIDYRFGKSNVSKDIYDHLLNVDLLIIDDLGTEGTNQLKLVELFNIINSRLLNNKKVTKTIISTNLSLQSLFENYDERIVSRLVGNYNICYFFGDDIRFFK